MEPLAKPVDQPLENPGKRRIRRRWWILIPFVILASLISFGVFVFANPSPSEYRFLAGIPVIHQQEWVLSLSLKGDFYFQEVDYTSDKKAADLFKQAKDELIPLGWKEDKFLPDDMILAHSESGQSILIMDMDKGALITVSKTRSATFLDRTRHWLKKRIPSLFKDGKNYDQFGDPLDLDFQNSAPLP